MVCFILKFILHKMDALHEEDGYQKFIQRLAI